MEQSNVIRTYQLYLNTSKATTSAVANTDITFVLNNPIKLISQNNRFKVRVISATIPFSFFQINSTNNVIQVITTSGIFDVTIPEGNYTITTLATSFTAEIQAYILLSFAIPITLTTSFNPNTSKETFSLSVSPPIYSIQVPYIAQNQPILNMLGFTTNFLVTNASPTITSNQVVNVNPASEIFIRSRTLTQASSTESLTGQCVTSNVIANIQINQPSFGVIQFYNPLNYYNDVVVRTIDSVNLYMTTLQGEMVGQSSPSTFCLEIIEVGGFNREIGMKQVGLMSEAEKHSIQLLEQHRNELVASLDTKLQSVKDKLKQKMRAP
jgi:hypothetical protein